MADIDSGINSMKYILKDNDVIDYIYGIIRPVAFNKEILNNILISDNPIEEYSKFITNIQNLDAYSAKQGFIFNEKENLIIGYYSFREGYRVIFPYKPTAEFQNWEMLNNKEVNEWHMYLLVEKNEENSSGLIQLDYKTFIERLPKEKYKFIDASYIMVDPFSKEEINKLIEGK